MIDSPLWDHVRSREIPRTNKLRCLFQKGELANEIRYDESFIGKPVLRFFIRECKKVILVQQYVEKCYSLNVSQNHLSNKIKY